MGARRKEGCVEESRKEHIRWLPALPKPSRWPRPTLPTSLRPSSEPPHCQGTVRLQHPRAQPSLPPYPHPPRLQPRSSFRTQPCAAAWTPGPFLRSRIAPPGSPTLSPRAFCRCLIHLDCSHLGAAAMSLGGWELPEAQVGGMQGTWMGGCSAEFTSGQLGVQVPALPLPSQHPWLRF